MSNVMSDIKAVNITGGAIADLGIPMNRRKSRKSKGGEQENRSQEQKQEQKQEILVPLAKNTMITKVGGAPGLFPVSQPAAVLTPRLDSQAEASKTEPSQQGGTKLIKVELKKSHASKKVKLHPKREIKSVAKDDPKTKKARKFILGVSSLHKRMTRAKKVHHTIKKIPIDVLRKQLIQAKLIKETSKAPEGILRQIAADSRIVGGKML